MCLMLCLDSWVSEGVIGSRVEGSGGLEVVVIKSLLTVVRTWKLLPSCWLICFSSNSIVVSWAAPDLRTVNGEFLGYQISWRERSSLPGLAGQVSSLQLRDPNLTRSDSLRCSYIWSNTAGCKVQPDKNKHHVLHLFVNCSQENGEDYPQKNTKFHILL